MLRAPEILLNQYAPNPQAEATQYGRAALVRIFHDMVVIREFETMLDRIKKEGVYQGIETSTKGRPTSPSARRRRSWVRHTT